MLKRYIGSFPEVTVTIAGNDYGLAKTGEAIPVPDDIAASVSWSEENWEDVTNGKPATKPEPDTNNDEDKAAE